jgi:3-oxoacyl-[acyl-carrier protein] reductase
MKPLKNKLALVTGVGRSAGIGAAICRELAKNGADIFFTYWHPYDQETYSDGNNDIEAITAELESLGIEVMSKEVDLANPNSAEILFQVVENEMEPLTILINNACHDFEIPFVELSPEILDNHYAVNVRAVTMLVKEFVKRGKSGHIINMTSGQSLGSMRGHKIPYTITKAALEILAPQLAPELSKVGISINSLNPGPTDTGWMTEEVKEMVLKDSKRGRLNTSEDIGKLVIEILTEGKHSTGEVIHAEW